MATNSPDTSAPVFHEAVQTVLKDKFEAAKQAEEDMVNNLRTKGDILRDNEDPSEYRGEKNELIRLGILAGAAEKYGSHPALVRIAGEISDRLPKARFTKKSTELLGIIAQGISTINPKVNVKGANFTVEANLSAGSPADYQKSAKTLQELVHNLSLEHEINFQNITPLMIYNYCTYRFNICSRRIDSLIAEKAERAGSELPEMAQKREDKIRELTEEVKAYRAIIIEIELKGEVTRRRKLANAINTGTDQIT